ncbi:MAG: toxin-antitoxin system YwqK family antitoxin [Bacteroidales bacterium]|nr:toxin-antitoxin system YwqK family antitoxin [Bacteroidales bacterium]
MKRFLYILFTVVLSVNLLAQKDTINQLDANDLKQGYWVTYDATKTTVLEEGRYVDSKKQGVWKAYYPDGTIKSEITFVNNKADGYAKFYFDNGKVSEEGIWKGTKWTGDYKFYHKNGQMAYEWQFNEKGKRTGVQKYYHDNGQLMIEGEWNDGKETGVIKEYYADGTLRSEKSFNNGQMDPTTVKTYEKSGAQVTTNNNNNNSNNTSNNDSKYTKDYYDGEGFHKLYTQTGKIESDGFFKNYKLIDGKKYYYSANGTLERVAVYKDGKVFDIEYKN